MRRHPWALTIALLGCRHDDAAHGGTEGSSGAVDTTAATSSAADAGSSGADEGSSGSDGTTTGAPDEPPPTTVSRAAVLADIGAPQLVAVRKSPTQLGDATQQDRCIALLPQLAGLPFLGNAYTCTIFHPNVLDALPDPQQRRTYFAAGFEEVRTMIGAEHVGSRRLTLEIGLDLLDAEPQRVHDYLAAMLEGARAARLPVIVNLDAVNWWSRRPDLWNFFDPAQPGYDPANLDNVEWIGQTGDGAPQVFWRNWGSQIRVATPIPNLSSPKLRAAIGEVLDDVLPQLVALQRELAHDEQYLFGGVIIGTELSIGVNHYYYADGNARLAEDPACDPGLPLSPGCPGGGPCGAYNHGQCPPDFASSPSGGAMQVGWHGALDLGLSVPPGRAELDAIVHDYVAFLAARITDAGLPATKIYSHTGGTFGAAGPHGYEAAYVPSVVPGWSMYFGGATDPAASIGEYVEANDDRRVLPWASPEWLPFDPSGGATADAWQTAIEDSLDYRNNRMISVANWEGISVAGAAVAALGSVMSSPRADACAVIAREVIGQADTADGVRLRLSDGTPDGATYFTASSSPVLGATGTLATIDTVNAMLEPGATTHDVPLPPAGQTTWVQVVTDGCTRDGAPQRTVSPLFAITAQGRDGSVPAGDTVLFASRGLPHATLTWTLPAGASAVMLELAREPEFVAIDEAIDVVGVAGWVRDGFDDAHPLYARLVVDGASSNTVVLR
ncbi:MAG: hypothetical protein K1X88_16415 [Nannocystaceae bacterium]|nr:hypothetical protein [Nannocystaceae bacterium]